MSQAKVKTESIDDYGEESLQISSTDVTSRMQRIEAIEKALKFVMNEVLKLKEEQFENVHQPRKHSNKKRKFSAAAHNYGEISYDDQEVDESLYYIPEENEHFEDSQDEFYEEYEPPKAKRSRKITSSPQQISVNSNFPEHEFVTIHKPSKPGCEKNKFLTTLYVKPYVFRKKADVRGNHKAHFVCSLCYSLGKTVSAYAGLLNYESDGSPNYELHSICTSGHICAPSTIDFLVTKFKRMIYASLDQEEYPSIETAYDGISTQLSAELSDENEKTQFFQGLPTVQNCKAGYKKRQKDFCLEDDNSSNDFTCFLCGHEIPLRNYNMHMEKCSKRSNKSEKITPINDEPISATKEEPIKDDHVSNHDDNDMSGNDLPEHEFYVMESEFKHGPKKGQTRFMTSLYIYPNHVYKKKNDVSSGRKARFVCNDCEALGKPVTALAFLIGREDNGKPLYKLDSAPNDHDHVCSPSNVRCMIAKFRKCLIVKAEDNPLKTVLEIYEETKNKFCNELVGVEKEDFLKEMPPLKSCMANLYKKRNKNRVDIPNDFMCTLCGHTIPLRNYHTHMRKCSKIHDHTAENSSSSGQSQSTSGWPSKKRKKKSNFCSTNETSNPDF